MSTKRIQGALLAAAAFTTPGLIQAAPLYFTGAGGNIWVADTSGVPAPSLLFSAPDTPAGIDLDESQNRLIWAGGGSDRWYAGNADGTGAPVILYADGGANPNAGAAVGVAIDEANNRVFMSDAGGSWRISSGATDGTTSPVNPVFTGNEGQASAVEYDPSTDQLYFGGPNTREVYVGAADGSSFRKLYDASGIRDIAIDPADGQIYWVDLNGVWSAAIDGTGTPSQIFGDYGGFLRAIEIDPLLDILYLGEFGVPSTGDRIWTANADGTGARTILYSGDFGSIRGIALTDAVVPAPMTALLLVLGLAGLRLTRCG